MLALQLIAPQLFISLLILILARALSGAITAAVLTIVASLTIFYACLDVKDPSIALQIVVYAALFSVMTGFLMRAQKNVNDKAIEKEKMAEEINLTRKEIERRIELTLALERKIDRFLGFQKFSEKIRDVADLHEAARLIVAEAHELLPQSDTSALYLVDEAKQELKLVVSDCRDGHSIRQKQGSIVDQWVMKRSQATLVEDSASDFRFLVEPRTDDPYLCSICASPLVTENKVLGVLRVSAAKKAAFSPDDLRLLGILSSLAAVVLRNRLLYLRMEELAIHDSLTGLYLNRYFQERLSEEIARSNLSKGVFSLIMLDIDLFKKINDEFGHTAGDIVLKNVAGIVTSRLSLVDLAGRYGGEEFVVLLPNRSHKEACELAEKMRHNIEKNKFLLRRSENRISASFGVATFPAHGHTR
ncbi:MAG: sensor domain-containing diguanylate cyclase, partial [Candidatus Omnitrophota bacterium]